VNAAPEDLRPQVNEMGKCKIEIRKIQDDRKRQATFLKRKPGLLNKVAADESDACGCPPECGRELTTAAALTGYGAQHSLRH
jgi:hypothetical protein